MVKQITLPEFLRVFGGGDCGANGGDALGQTATTAASATPALMLTDNTNTAAAAAAAGGVGGGALPDAAALPAPPGGGVRKQPTAAQTIAAFGMQLGELGAPAPKLQPADSMEGKYPPMQE